MEAVQGNNLPTTCVSTWDSADEPNNADWAGYLVRSGYVTPAYMSYLSYLSPLTSAPTMLHKYLTPIIERVSQKPDLAAIALILLILFLSLKVLNMLYQAVMFWVRLAFRIIFWGSIVVLALWLVNRGFDGATQDVGYWAKTWSGELDYWKKQAESAAVAHGASATSTAVRQKRYW